MCEVMTHALVPSSLTPQRAAEIYLPLKREILVTKKQLEELHVALEMNTTSLQTQQEVLSRTKKQAQTAAETSRLDQMVAEDRIAKLITKLEAEIEKRKECEEKANRYDEVENLKLRQEV